MIVYSYHEDYRKTQKQGRIGQFLIIENFFKLETTAT